MSANAANMSAARRSKDSALYRIGAAMADAGLDSTFIHAALGLAAKYEGVRDLMFLWSEAKTKKARGEIIADLQEQIDESRDHRAIEDRPTVRPKVRYNEIDDMAAEIKAFKDALRVRVDKWGGVAKLARATGIPQPSLSRFFRSVSIPRQTTIFKIMAAMDLSEKDITMPWRR